MNTTLPVPPVVEYVIRDRVGTQTITARHLGTGSSFADGKRRWLDVDIYAEANGGGYIVHTVGHTTFDDEITRVRIARTRSAWEVVELLTVTHKGSTYIPRDSARALAQAAAYDEAIRDAYVNRAV